MLYVNSNRNMYFVLRKDKYRFEKIVVCKEL